VTFEKEQISKSNFYFVSNRAPPGIYLPQKEKSIWGGQQRGRDPRGGDRLDQNEQRSVSGRQRRGRDPRDGGRLDLNEHHA